jgi:tetraacyldisaccharide 4'-kinase
LNPLSSIYGAVAAARNYLYDGSRLPIRRLRGPVVSVGNLSTGGSGKTPFVMLLGGQLKECGIPFDILSRGYRRRSKGVRMVEPTGSAIEFGDEPLLLARRLEVPVLVGENRFLAGLAAEKQFGPQLHILDDGFQHRALARDFDIVLLSNDDPHDHLLPSGRLREPLASLQRADALVVTNDARPAVSLSRQLLWFVHRGIRVEHATHRPIAFCGIARSQNFFRGLRENGVQPVAEIAFRDHHRYSGNDIRDLLALRAKHSSTAFLTTEKDLVNLGVHSVELAPLHAIPVTMTFADPVDAVDTMLRIIDERRRRS